jgi:hypothetical protein
MKLLSRRCRLDIGCQKTTRKNQKNKYMKKQIALFALVASALMAVPAASYAQDAAPTPATTNAPAAKKHSGLPFHGKLAALDATAGTITVGKMTISVTADTKITKDGNTAKLADFAVGDQVAGAYKKDGDKLTATVLHTGEKAKKKAKAE